MDHVFADIVIGTGTTGIYDIKILYQFEKTEYKRKLIGIFDYDNSTGRYKTRTGNNPFGGVARVFVRDPYFAGVVTPPPTIVTSSTGASVPATTPTTTASGTSTVTMADISQAYNEKRYLTTISLSNTYLTFAKPTTELLSVLLS